jgi:hypothetical protein
MQIGEMDCVSDDGRVADPHRNVSWTGSGVWGRLAGGSLGDRHDGPRATHAFPPVDETLGAKVLMTSTMIPSWREL